MARTPWRYERNVIVVDVIIASAARTAIGTSYKGSLVGVDAYRLAEIAMGAAVSRSGIDPAPVTLPSFWASTTFLASPHSGGAHLAWQRCTTSPPISPLA